MYTRIIYTRETARCKNKGTCVLPKGFNAPYDAPVYLYTAVCIYRYIYYVPAAYARL